MKRQFLAALALVAAPVVAQQTLNMRDADIRAFIQDAARVTGRTFIIDQRVAGKVSVVTDRPLSKSEYFEVFLSTLRANGLVAIPTGGGAYRIQPVEGAATQAGAVGRAANRNAFVTEVFRLHAIDAATTLDTLRPLVSREGSVTANRAGNSLVVSDFADNVQRIRALIAQLDRTNDQTTIIKLQNAGAREIATSLQALVAPPAGTQGAAAAATVVPIDGSNSIAIRGDATTAARLAQTARDLDRQAAAGTEIRVYWLEHADADRLMPVLQQLLGQQATQPTAQQGLAPVSSGLNGASRTGAGGGTASAPVAAAPIAAAPMATAATTPAGQAGIPTRGPAIVTRYEGANALIIASSADVQRQLGEVIRQLDTRRDQVLVEAIIVEIGDTAAKNLGVQFLLGSTKTGFAATNFANAQPNLLTIAGAIGASQLTTTTTTTTGTSTVTGTTSQFGSTLQEAAVSSLLNATGGFAGLAGKLGANGVFGSIINAVQSDTESNILSTPSVLTLDNQQAHFLVGQEVPVSTGEALSQNFDNQFRTVQRQNVGIQLDVKPQINAGGEIKLFLRQEVSSVAGPVSSNSSDLIINKREIETTVTVDDGEILVLGGLLDDNERRTIEKIPLLGDIPVLGNLFRSKARSRAKTNLMVFIRPTILRTPAEARALSQQRYGYVREQQALMNPEVEPSLDVLVREYMGAVPPGEVAARPGDVAVAPPLPEGAPVAPADATVAPPPAPEQPVVVPIETHDSTTVIHPVELPPSKVRP